MNNDYSGKKDDSLAAISWDEAKSSPTMSSKLESKIVEYLNADVRSEAMIMDLIQMGGNDYVSGAVVKGANQDYLLVHSIFNSWDPESTDPPQITELAIPFPFPVTNFEEAKRALQHFASLSQNRYEGMSFIVDQRSDSKAARRG